MDSGAAIEMEEERTREMEREREKWRRRTRTRGERATTRTTPMMHTYLGASVTIDPATAKPRVDGYDGGRTEADGQDADPEKQIT